MYSYLFDILQKEIDRHKEIFPGREALFNSTKLYIEDKFDLVEDQFYSPRNYRALKKVAKLLRDDLKIEQEGATEMYAASNLKRMWIEARDLDQEYGFEPMIKTIVDFVGNCYEFEAPGFTL